MICTLYLLINFSEHVLQFLKHLVLNDLQNRSDMQTIELAKKKLKKMEKNNEKKSRTIVMINRKEKNWKK